MAASRGALGALISLSIRLEATAGGVAGVEKSQSIQPHAPDRRAALLSCRPKSSPFPARCGANSTRRKPAGSPPDPLPPSARSGRGQRRRPSRRRKCLKGSAMALGPLKFLMFWDQAPSGGKLRCLKYAIKPTTCAPPTAALLSCLPKPPLVSPRLSHPSYRIRAPGFLTKPFRDQALLDAIHLGLSRDKAARENRRTLAALNARFASLSPRERDIMLQVVSGRLSKQIAGDMGIAEATVKVHRSRLMRKMRARSLPELGRMADKLKLGPDETQHF